MMLQAKLRLPSRVAAVVPDRHIPSGGYRNAGSTRHGNKFHLSRLAFFFALLFPIFAPAQTVRWEADPSSPNSVQLVFRDCEPDGNPTLPAIPGATLTFLGQSSNVSIVNFQMSRSVSYSYLVRARQSTPVQIPAFTARTNKGPVNVPAFTVAQPGASVDSVASSRLIPERTSVWAGEVFGLTYELSASRRNEPQISPDFEWRPSPLIAEDWTKPEVLEAVVGGDRRLQVIYRTRAIAKKPDAVRLEAANHLLSVRVGTIGFGIISQPRMEAISVTSDQPTLVVRPLPTPPPDFSGAVGEFKLVSRVVPEQAGVGEPVTWTLELSGTGNWPDLAGLPSREVSNDFQVVQPKAKRTPSEGRLFDATLVEDVVLVPTKPGNYALGPINFSYFDPRSGTYQTVTTPRTMLAIAGPTTPLFNVMPQPETAPPPATTTKRATPPATPVAPIGIPRDPLPGSESVMAPLSRRALALWLSAPFVGLLLFWAGLAVRQAHRTDPGRARREAHAGLVRTLTQIAKAGPSARAALLLDWQRDSAVLWQIAHAAPPATAFERGAPPPTPNATTGEGATPETIWSSLWREADRTLYGEDVPLPADWVNRATAALAAKPAPAFRPLRAFLPKNLMPFAAAIALLGATIPVLVRAADSAPGAAYQRGDFAAAEKGWRTSVTQQPTDWIARHNLSLALAQQDNAGEAAAQAAAAFVQQPANASIQWHFALTSEKAGAAPAALAGFLKPTARQSIARLSSPARWQAWLIAAAFAAATALGAMLYNAYGPRRRSHTWVAAAILLASLALAGTASAGMLAYGMAGDARAVLVAQPGILRSIPTEADTAQKTLPMVAGTMAIADRTFLGWTHIAFDNGQTGWVRKEEIVPLWK